MCVRGYLQGSENGRVVTMQIITSMFLTIKYVGQKYSHPQPIICNKHVPVDINF